MVELTPNLPLANAALPFQIGDVIIDELPPGHVLSIMPFAGQGPAVSAYLEKSFGCALPPAGQVVACDGHEIFWTGLNQWFLCGPSVRPALIAKASTTDQSDGWAILSLQGAASRDVLARLCPLDLRNFKRGQVARTEFAHMMSIILPSREGYDIWVMRSFAHTALEHLKAAATSLNAIKSLRS